MSKDKGSKNHKKAPADKSSGKKKAPSAYQAEKKGGKEAPTIEVFIPKTDDKKGGNHKKSQ
jgi:hypothetical protein